MSEMLQVTTGLLQISLKTILLYINNTNIGINECEIRDRQLNSWLQTVLSRQ